MLNLPLGTPAVARVLPDHVGEMLVAEGDKVKRGQLIARLGNNQDNFSCIWGVRHLHFQIGRKYRDKFHKGTY